MNTHVQVENWKGGVLAPFMYFRLPDDYKTRYTQLEFHYECVPYDLDECDYAYVEIDGTGVFISKYINHDKDWAAQTDIHIMNADLARKLKEAIFQELKITQEEVTWERTEFLN